MRSTILACLLVLLAACTGQLPPPASDAMGPDLVQSLDNQTPQPPGTQPPRATEAGQEAAACAARGGNYQPVCLMGRPMCVVRHADAGKSCTDSSQCAGRCVAENAVAGGKAGAGVCTRDNNPCGCFSIVANGVVQPALCVD